MIKTQAGLPNTCHDCGAPQTATWFASSVDAAIAGGGICAPCLAKRAGGVVIGFSATLEVNNQELADGATGPPIVAAETPITPDPLPSGEGVAAKKGKSTVSPKKGK